MQQPAQICNSTQHISIIVTHVVLGCVAGAAASTDLQQHFSMSKEQAEGVLNMSLRRLTSLESARLQEEAQQLTER